MSDNKPEPNSLLAKAMSIPHEGNKITHSDEELDLALALCRGKITFSQCAKAMDYKTVQNAANFMSRSSNFNMH